MSAKPYHNSIESLLPDQITWERLHCFTRNHLAKFIHDLIGGSWDSIRAMNKDDMILAICEKYERKS